MEIISRKNVELAISIAEKLVDSAAGLVDPH
jgi:hypothetical protein